MSVITAGKGTEGRTLAEDLIADAKVDHESNQDVAPNGSIVRIDANGLPVSVDPAP